MNSANRFCKKLIPFVSIFLCNIVFAQDSSETDSIEEILVTSEKSLSAIKSQMESAQDQAFDLYNELYTDTDYEIICKREYIPYSRRSDRFCDTRFVRDRQQEALEDYMLDLEAGATEDDPMGLTGGLSSASYFEVEQHIEQVDQKIDALYFADSEFRRKVDEYETLRTAYEEALEADSERGFWSRLFGSPD